MQKNDMAKYFFKNIHFDLHIFKKITNFAANLVNHINNLT
jgi:hypothetical protein